MRAGHFNLFGPDGAIIFLSQCGYPLTIGATTFPRISSLVLPWPRCSFRKRSLTPLLQSYLRSTVCILPGYALYRATCVQALNVLGSFARIFLLGNVEAALDRPGCARQFIGMPNLLLLNREQPAGGTHAGVRVAERCGCGGACAVPHCWLGVVSVGSISVWLLG